MLNKTSIVDNVRTQFPDFYTEYGDTFIEFIKVYYEWLETESYTGPTKDVPSLLDIDTTTTEFLKFFKKQYMNGMPEEILGNQRYLQKHILDIYRSKGSDEGMRLLFRLLYNKEIDIYIPGKDVLKPSSGKWVKRRYMEISDSPISPSLEGKEIKGEISGAICIVESYDIINRNGNRNHILWISNIEGNFLENEKVYDDFADIATSPSIKGSVIGATVLSSVPGYSLGEEMVSTTDSLLKFKVKETNPVALNGNIVPNLIKVGEGYRSVEDTVFTYDKRGVAGSNLAVGPILRDSGETLLFTDEILGTYANVALNAADYGMPGPGADNANSIMAEALLATEISLYDLYDTYVIDAGAFYDDVVDIHATDEDILRLELRADDDTFYGNNAVIEGYASFGTNRALSLNIIDSSFNYPYTEIVQLQTSDLKFIEAQLIIGAIGVAEGYYGDSNGFLSDNKYIHDSVYYQEYSYDIKLNETFKNYFDILLKVVHPAGKKAFGNSRVLEKENINLSITSTIESVAE